MVTVPRDTLGRSANSQKSSDLAFVLCVFEKKLRFVFLILLLKKDGNLSNTFDFNTKNGEKYMETNISNRNKQKR